MSEPIRPTAVVYARVSTKDKDQDPETQLRNIRRYCQENDIDIVAEYVEKKSAKDMDRSQFRSAIGHIATSRVNYLIAWSESRLSRDTGDMSEIVEICKARNTLIRYVSNSSVQPEDDTGELVNYMNTWQAKRERELLAKNTKHGIDTAKRKGIHCGRKLAFCFSENYVRDKAMIEEVGKKPTRLASIPETMAYASQGLTVNYVATQVYKVSYHSLKNALVAEGLYEEYNRRVDLARGRLQQTDVATNVLLTPENVASNGEVDV